MITPAIQTSAASTSQPPLSSPATYSRRVIYHLPNNTFSDEMGSLFPNIQTSASTATKNNSGEGETAPVAGVRAVVPDGNNLVATSNGEVEDDDEDDDEDDMEEVPVPDFVPSVNEAAYVGTSEEPESTNKDSSYYVTIGYTENQPIEHTPLPPSVISSYSELAGALTDNAPSQTAGAPVEQNHLSQSGRHIAIETTTDSASNYARGSSTATAGATTNSAQVPGDNVAQGEVMDSTAPAGPRQIKSLPRPRAAATIRRPVVKLSTTYKTNPRTPQNVRITDQVPAGSTGSGSNPATPNIQLPEDKDAAITALTAHILQEKMAKAEKLLTKTIQHSHPELRNARHDPGDCEDGEIYEPWTYEPTRSSRGAQQEGDSAKEFVEGSSSGTTSKECLDELTTGSTGLESKGEDGRASDVDLRIRGSSNPTPGPSHSSAGTSLSVAPRRPEIVPPPAVVVATAATQDAPDSQESRKSRPLPKSIRPTSSAVARSDTGKPDEDTSMGQPDIVASRPAISNPIPPPVIALTLSFGSSSLSGVFPVSGNSSVLPPPVVINPPTSISDVVYDMAQPDGDIIMGEPDIASVPANWNPIPPPVIAPALSSLWSSTSSAFAVSGSSSNGAGTSASGFNLWQAPIAPVPPAQSAATKTQPLYSMKLPTLPFVIPSLQSTQLDLGFGRTNFVQSFPIVNTDPPPPYSEINPATLSIPTDVPPAAPPSSFTLPLPHPPAVPLSVPFSQAEGYTNGFVPPLEQPPPAPAAQARNTLPHLPPDFLSGSYVSMEPVSSVPPRKVKRSIFPRWSDENPTRRNMAWGQTREDPQLGKLFRCSRKESPPRSNIFTIYVNTASWSPARGRAVSSMSSYSSKSSSSSSSGINGKRYGLYDSEDDDSDLEDAPASRRKKRRLEEGDETRNESDNSIPVLDEFILYPSLFSKKVIKVVAVDFSPATKRVKRRLEEDDVAENVHLRSPVAVKKLKSAGSIPAPAKSLPRSTQSLRKNVQSRRKSPPPTIDQRRRTSTIWNTLTSVVRSFWT